MIYPKLTVVCHATGQKQEYHADDEEDRDKAQPVCSEAGFIGAQDRPRFDKFSRAISAN
jgi:hypothetical protein